MRRLALLPVLALAAALAACQPAGSRCVEWGVKYKKVYVYSTGKKSRVEYRSEPVCNRYEIKEK